MPNTKSQRGKSKNSQVLTDLISPYLGRYIFSAELAPARNPQLGRIGFPPHIYGKPGMTWMSGRAEFDLENLLLA